MRSGRWRVALTRSILFAGACGIAFAANAVAQQPASPSGPSARPINSIEELGKELFFDTLLSGDRQTACATCHKPELLFTDGLARPTGGRQRIMGGRNTPTLLGVGELTHLFWDGGAASLEAQASRVLRSPIELDRNLPDLLDDLSAVRRYREAADRLFEGQLTEEAITRSLAAFQRTLLRRDTEYDRYVAGEANALRNASLRGYELFFGKAGCSQCHSGPDLTDSGFHNLGVPPDGPLRDDWGRYGITKDPADMHKFKTPTLKGITNTAPYMHNGVFPALGDVLRFKNAGCGQDANLSPYCRPLGLSREEIADLIVFLRLL